MSVLSRVFTVRATAERRLADRERSERAILDALDEGVITIDAHGQVSQANPAACVIMGVDLDNQPTDSPWSQCLVGRETDTGPTVDVGARVLRTGLGARDVHVEAVRPDGSHVSLSVNYQPLTDHAGEGAGLVLSLRDVSEHHRNLQDLLESRDRLREAHGVARLASWEWQPQTGDVLIVGAIAQEQGLAGERLALSELLEGMAPQERERAAAGIAAMVQGDRDETVNRSRRDYPTGPRWLETRARAVRDANGDLLCIRGTSQDVTENHLAEQQAKQAQHFLQSTLDSLSSHIAVLTEHGEIAMTNRAWVQHAASDMALVSEVGGNYLTALDAASGGWQEQLAAGLRAILGDAETHFSQEYCRPGPDGDRWFLARAARLDDRGLSGIVVWHDDVTDLWHAKSELATQAALLDEVDVAVIATDVDGRVTHWNRGAQRLHGWSYAEAIGRRAAGLIYASGVPVGEDGAGDRGLGPFTVARKDGSTFPADRRERKMVDGSGNVKGTISVIVDMSERVASQHALDSVHTYMRAVADGMGEGLFTLDTQGHPTYLNEAAETLLGWTQPALAGRAMHDVVHFRALDGTPLTRADCPIWRAGRDGQTVRIDDDLFIRRDGSEMPVSYTAAPFETEDGLAGCVVVFRDITENKAREQALEQDAETLAWISRIHEGLAEDRFLLYGQPVVDLRTGEQVQSELLLRLRNPDGTVVGPGAFLPIAERYGLIGEIDRWVIAHGVEIAGSGEPVQINLSAPSIGDPTILEAIESAIEKHGVDPAHLVFEITETAILEDEKAASEFADRLRALGCRLALDDFGTGYGGFTLLKQLTTDYLKIDIEFVRDLIGNEGSRHVVEAVVALALGFDMQTVAEGVEDAETLTLLRELGVDRAQGYHIARPAPLERPEPQTTRGNP